MPAAMRKSFLVLFFKKELLLSSFFLIAAAPASVLTYHGDNLRTGWNAQETALTPANVGGGTFGLLAQVTLDELVTAQPLIVPGVAVQGQGTHDVAYIATENNTIYALDAATGAVLLQRNLGPPVQASTIPGGCNKSSGVVGIDSTPVIDAKSSTLYVMVYTVEQGAAVYRLHALSIASLADARASVVVSASAKRVRGKPYQFQASASRQRPALLLAGGNVYAGFGSFCDHNRQNSRGWVLGWHASDLTPLAGAELINRQVNVPHDYFLSSVWMSGAGPAADAAGNVYVVTGNSDKSGDTYDSTFNPAESVLKLSPDLASVTDYFTPGGPVYGEPQLDKNDRDFGAGGILLLPPQAGNIANLAVAAGKVGILYLLNQAHLGGYTPSGPDNILGSVSMGNCWCTQSYFTGADGAGRVVSSGGNNLMVWRLQTSPSPALTLESQSATLPTGTNEGFFTFVTSNASQAGSAIIWAVARPDRKGSPNLTLLAYNAADSTMLFSATAGTWVSTQVNANVVPVVANGRAYVGSYKSLAIFGLGGRHNSLR